MRFQLFEKINGRSCATDKYLEYIKLINTWEFDWGNIYEPILIGQNLSDVEIRIKKVEFFDEAESELIRLGFTDAGDDPFGRRPSRNEVLHVRF